MCHQELYIFWGDKVGFLQEIWRQGRAEQENYIHSLLDNLGQAAVDVSLPELRRVFTLVDPHIGMLLSKIAKKGN